MSEAQTNGKENTYNQEHDETTLNPHPNMPPLNRAMSVTLTNEQFSELYLQPTIRSNRQLSALKALGNPTPLGIICFVLSLLPTSCILMNFRQANSLTDLPGLLPVHLMVGGLGMTLAGVGEFLVGNSFPMLVFASFGVFWLSLGIFLDPNYGIATALGDTFALPFAFYFHVWGVFVTILTVAALKTNVILVLILLTVALTFYCLGAGYMIISNGNTDKGVDVLKAAGGCGFTASVIGLYLMCNLALSTTEFPYLVPLFDLAPIWKKRD